MTLLQVDGVTKQFGGLTAVNNVSFSVEEGQICSVIGPNGAGKSTLFKLISSFLVPTSGQVRFDGAQVSGLKPHVAARMGVVRTFQETTVFKEMTALENVIVAHQLGLQSRTLGVFLGSRLARDENAAIRDSSSEILDYLGLGHVKDERAVNLPHGYLRALGIAIAMAAKPRLLLLDEPFAGMNPDETNRAMEMVQGIRRRGITVLLVEHDMRAVMNISDWIVVISFGSKIAEGKPEAIRADEAVIAAYLGEDDLELGH
ncbi:branched-chain amino acid transport system ATP-binding protein [Amaricoccus macauensis]|uniref:Branched-chain amino acid transport system ATP-binding protein n=1 Tax=Amaricoccus macauensis TaxID=57001 RepID=A0A840SPB8_9RHOB|nr:ABC transporter ATP-binding protein [Amaricoccus macauensis]MBB5221696.1 branched-chain amino acid transport system ATP-binding protein [Amaricoccus macauensis]